MDVWFYYRTPRLALEPKNHVRLTVRASIAEPFSHSRKSRSEGVPLNYKLVPVMKSVLDL